MTDIITEEIGLPGITSKASKNDYRVRYFKANVSDPGELTELELIETEARMSNDKMLLSKDTFTFQDNFYVVISYLEKRD